MTMSLLFRWTALCAALLLGLSVMPGNAHAFFRIRAVAVVAPAPIVVAPAPIVVASAPIITPAPVVVTPAPVVSYSVPAPVTSVGVTVTGPLFRVRHLASVVVGAPLPVIPAVPVITASPVLAFPCCPAPVIVSYP
jgi:hypothetical protein